MEKNFFRQFPLHLVLLPVFSVASITVQAQMVSPEIDRGPVFSYTAKPTDLVGVMGAPSATEITPEGFLYNGFGELMFLTGPEQEPISARIRTLEAGHLPIYHYSVTNLGVEYRFKVFAAQIPTAQTDPSQPTGQIANFVRVTLHNATNTPRSAFLTVAERYQGEQTTAEPIPDNRFRRPAEPERIGDYRQPGEAFKADWAYAMKDGFCLRENRALFHFPSDPIPQQQLTLRTHYNRIQPVNSNTLKLTPTTPVCSARYTVVLAPGEEKTLTFTQALIPPAAGTPEAANLASADPDAAENGVRAFWTRLFAKGMQIDLPESKPVDTFYASLLYDLLGRNIIDGQYVQAAGQFQYHRFYLRDSADFVRMYDATGYADIGSEAIRFFLNRQTPEGNFLSQPNQYDGWGEAMWTFGEHYRRTHDLAFAERVYPAMLRAIDWLEAARKRDPLHLISASDVRDNEYVPGHLTGYNFLALDGIRSAIVLAQALGKKEDVIRFEHLYADYRDTFFPLLDKASREQGGKLPPSLDAGEWKGTDWGNLLSVTPEQVLTPFDTRVTATLQSTQARYQEGVTTYAEPDDGVFLHHYLMIKNTQTELIRDEQHQAIREFYALLLHTSSTHAGFEYAIRPWGMRDFAGNLAPHAWFAADYRNLFRNMMLREEGEDLHLFSALSPAWIGAGKTVSVRQAPSYYGNLDFQLAMGSDDSATLTLDSHFTHPPRRILVHIPWFLTVKSATVDGRPVKVGRVLELPASAHAVTLKWEANANPKMSYDNTTESYKQEYRRRWEHMLATGDSSFPTPDPWQIPE